MSPATPSARGSNFQGTPILAPPSITVLGYLQCQQQKLSHINPQASGCIVCIIPFLGERCQQHLQFLTENCMPGCCVHLLQVENGEKQEEMLYVKGPQTEFQIYIRSFNSGVLIAYICVEKTLGFPFYSIIPRH